MRLSLMNSVRLSRKPSRPGPLPMELMKGVEPSTSSLPRTCSTTELRQHLAKRLLFTILERRCHSFFGRFWVIFQITPKKTSKNRTLSIAPVLEGRQSPAQTSCRFAIAKQVFSGLPLPRSYFWIYLHLSGFLSPPRPE